ncbi:uncharacterized protein CBL_06562 [Carabus blaptoides fortunei]
MLHVIKRSCVLNNVQSAIAKMAKRLAVFDFDHTIVDDNTDIVARRLLKNEQIPDSTKILYRSSGWTVYMQEIFKLLHKFGIPQTSVKHAIQQIPAVSSIPKLIKTMDSCKLSTINLCKGMIMEDFVKQQAESGVVYNQIVYAGDGKNDFCPILRLSENDLACVREGYPCVDLVRQASSGNSKEKVRANVCVWKNGDDILQRIE